MDAYTYPEEFEECDGSATISPGVHVGQQPRRAFGLAYSTVVGNDTQGNAYGEKIHLYYNVRVSPAGRDYETINDTPEALLMSWEFQTTPVDLDALGLEPAAAITIDSTEVDPTAFKALQDKLYGADALEAQLPDLDEVIGMFSE